MSSRKFAGWLVPFVMSFAALAQGQDVGGDLPPDDAPPPPDSDGGTAMPMPNGVCFGIQPAECAPDAIGTSCGDNGTCFEGVCATISGLCGRSEDCRGEG